MGGAKRRQEALDGPGIERQFAVREVECGRVGLGRAAGARDGSDRAVERVAGLGQERLAGAGESDPAVESLEQRDPSSVSRSWICLERAGWATLRRRAARANPSSSATATK